MHSYTLNRVKVKSQVNDVIIAQRKKNKQIGFVWYDYGCDDNVASIYDGIKGGSIHQAEAPGYSIRGSGDVSMNVENSYSNRKSKPNCLGLRTRRWRVKN